MTIIINDSRRDAAVSPFRLGDAVVKTEDMVLVQPLSTYHEGADPKNAQSKPYLATRSHAGELVALRIAKIVEPKPAPTEPPVEEPENEEGDDVEEPEVEQEDDASDAAATDAPTPRRRGRPPGRRG